MSDIHNQREIENLQAEIERLRAENERLRAALENIQQTRVLQGKAIIDASNEIERLRADNDQHLIDLEEYRLDVERLRAALAGLLPFAEFQVHRMLEKYNPRPISNAINEARAALEGK
jgi:cell division septum initiation protein DivIVA